jgi:hypothetical protein
MSTIAARVAGVNQSGRVANNRSSVEVLPLAPGANGQPPRPPSDPSTIEAPVSIAASVFATPRPHVSCP